MDKALLMKRLRATFLEELEGHVRDFNDHLPELEKAQTDEQRAAQVAILFRTVHSLKGASAAVNVTLLQDACHRLENLFEAMRQKKLAPGPEVLGLLYEAIDAIEAAGMCLREQQDLSGSPLAELLGRLDAASTGQTPASPVKRAPRPVEVEHVPEVIVAPPAPPEPTTTSVRVPAERLDSLLARVGELLVAHGRVEARTSDLHELTDFVEQWQREVHHVEPTPLAVRTRERLRELGKSLERVTRSVVGDGRLLRQVTDPLHEEVRRVRMLPFAEGCRGLDRIVRDLSLSNGKDVALVIEGGDVELDRSVLESLKDPLRHLVRNAVDHGVETTAARQAAGKPPRARIVIRAELRGSQVEVVVQDDGKGLNFDALREQARRRQLPEPSDEQELARLIFLPGLSTAAIITDVSGRGVGLDVVKSRVEALHGKVDVTSQVGAGVRFSLTVPLTLTTLRAVLVGVAEQTFAFAGTCVERLLRVPAKEVKSIAGRPVLSYEGAALPLASLAAVLGLNATPPGAALEVMIVSTGEKRLAFAVDAFLSEQEIVVKSLGTRIKRLRFVSGATLLASGRIALVLNAANVVRAALSQVSPRGLPVAATGEAAPPRKRLLVADDSVTTRTLEKSILEAAGYEVLTASDGLAAWQLLQEHGADLLVSDVEMPRMDGFTLAATVRGSPRFHELPVVLVTARETEEDRKRGIEAGANAYLVKSGFDQRNLLETIGQLL